jgi:hypothetical protein
LLDNESGTYLVLQKGIVQRQETIRLMSSETP